MEIPFVVHPRKDTGLFNSKIAIWLFLASEVMLFGGFFSAYIFLRLGADYPWPERTLPVLPGLINTFVLIASSVTVVFAWASLKLRNWGNFRIFMGITVLCSLIFMVFKGIEYNVKFHHQAVRLNDYTVIEGHLGYELKKGANHHHPESDDYELDHHGHRIEENLIRVRAGNLTFSTLRHHAQWVEEILNQARHQGSKIVIADNLEAITKPGEGSHTVIAKKGDQLSLALLEKIKQIHLDARSQNARVRAQNLRKQWEEAKKENPGKRDWEITSSVNIDTEALEEEKLLLTEIPSVSFHVDPPAVFSFKPRDIQEGKSQSKLRDDTQITGDLLPSPMVFHHVDAIDFQHMAMKAVERGLDPIEVIEDSWLIRTSAFARQAWEWNKAEVAKLEKRLIDEYGVDEVTKRPNREPTAKERYRIGWKDFVSKKEGASKSESIKTIKEEFIGPNYADRGLETFPSLEVPREQIRFGSKFTPSWNTYYAIYFTVTGLHGLHVIGGAIVLAYYLFFGRGMYEKNPEWLANRVEVGGLFWHFVDLVWIFVFPIFYLM